MKKKFQSSFIDNKTDLLYTYTSNKYFENFIFQKEYFPYQFDSWKDKINYGVSYKNYFIYPKNSIRGLIKNDNSQTFSSLIFVADAFRDLKSYYKQFARSSKLSNAASIYSNLEAKSALKDLNEEYIKYINILYSVFLEIFTTSFKFKELNSFEIFFKHFIEFTRTLTKYTPFTRSGFLSSNKCDLAVSGLSISLDDSLSFFDPDAKERSYVSDPDFEAFVNNAKRFGFYVDRNIPWRIVADLESPVMKDYYRRYSANSLDELFNKYYFVAHYSDLETNKNILLSFWNKLTEEKKRTNITKDIINCKNVFAESTTLKPITVENFDLIYDINWQLRLQLFLKVLESRVFISQKTFENLYLEVIKINKYYNTNSALDFINDKIFDLKNLEKQKTSDLTSEDHLAKIAANNNRLLQSDLIVF